MSNWVPNICLLPEVEKRKTKTKTNPKRLKILSIMTVKQTHIQKAKEVGYSYKIQVENNP